MLLTAFFSDEGVPKTGLSPTIDVWEDDGTHSVNAQAMVEIAGGWYKYNFAGYDESKDYVVRADGGAGLADNDRYCYSSNEVGQVTEDLTDIKGTGFVKDTDSLIDIRPETDKIQDEIIAKPGDFMADVSALALEATAQLIKTEADKIPGIVTETNKIQTGIIDTPNTYKANVAALALEATSQLIKTEADKIPGIVTEVAKIQTGIIDTPNTYKANVAGLAPANEYDAELTAIQADLDNPDQYKANVAGLAPANEYDAVLTAIQADLDNPDQYKANVAAMALEATSQLIKTETDKIQPDIIASPGDYKANVASLAPAAGYNKLYFKNDDKVYVLDSDGNETEIGAGGGAATFLDLTDTPAAYAGDKGKSAVVNAAEDGLEFIDVGTKWGNVFLDNFDDASLAWHWRMHNTNAAKTIVEAGDDVTIHVDNGTPADFIAGENTAPKVIIGARGFPLEIVWKQTMGTVNDDTMGGVVFSADITGLTANFCYVSRIRNDSAGQNGITFYSVTGGHNYLAITTNPIWFRMRITAEGDGGKWTAAYSADGIAWTDIATVNDACPEWEGDMALIGRNWGVDNQVDVDFESFRMEEQLGTDGLSVDLPPDTYKRWTKIVMNNATHLAFGAVFTSAGTNSNADDDDSNFTWWRTGNSSGNGAGIYTATNNFVRPHHNLIYVCKFKTHSDITNMRFFIGLAANNTDWNADPTNGNLIMLRYVSGTANFTYITKDGSTLNSQDSGVVVAASTIYTLKIVVSEDGAKATFTLNGANLVDSAANLPSASTPLGLTVWLITQENAYKYLALSQIYCEGD